MQNTHSLHNLGSQLSSYQPGTKETTPNNQHRARAARAAGCLPKNLGRWQRQWPINYTSSSSLPPTPLLSYYIGSLPGCKSWWHNAAQETSKHGLKQENAMQTAPGFHTKEIKGALRGKYIPSDLFCYFLSLPSFVGFIFFRSSTFTQLYLFY